MSKADVVRDKQSLDFILRSGLAGGLAGCVAKTAIAPLDRVKILFQTSNPDFRSYSGSWTGVFRAGRDIYAETGWRGLLQGHSATLARVFPYAAIKFMAYDQVRHILMPTRADETNVRRFLAGSISGTISVVFTYPLELIRVRMAFQTRRFSPTTPSPSLSTLPLRPSIKSAITNIYREGPAASPAHLFDKFPILKFYRGFTPTIIGMVPYAGTSFLTWDYLRARFLPPPGAGKPKPTPGADLAIGAVSGVISQAVSYPFEVVRRRMQVGGLTSPGRWMRWGETARAIYRDGAADAQRGSWRRVAMGARGFYVGLSVGYLKVVPMTAVSYAAWQGLKRALDI